MTIHREPLTSDIIFKAVFGRDTKESKEALIELLNLVLDRVDDPIVDLTYLNPFSIAEIQNEKTIVMDVKVETSRHELIDIEMQIGDLNVYINRTVFYGCKQLSKSLERGYEYDRMKKSIVVSFIKTTLFPPDVPVHSTFTLCEKGIGRELTDILELHYIELGKIRLDAPNLDELDPLERFGAYLRYSGDANKSEIVETLVEKGDRVISMTDKVLRKISEEERLQALREDREMGELWHNIETTHARDVGFKQGRSEGFKQGQSEGFKQGQSEGLEKGLEKGRMQGLETGRLEAQRDVAIKLKQMGMDLKAICEATGLREKEIKNL